MDGKNGKKIRYASAQKVTDGYIRNHRPGIILKKFLVIVGAAVPYEIGARRKKKGFRGNRKIPMGL